MSQAHILHIAHNLLHEIGEKEHKARRLNSAHEGYGLILCDGEVVVTEINRTTPMNGDSEPCYDDKNQLIAMISSDDAMALYAEDGRIFGRIIEEVQSHYANT